MPRNSSAYSLGLVADESRAIYIFLLFVVPPTLAQNPAMTPRPLAEWPGAEIAEGVAFQGDGSVTLEASSETGPAGAVLLAAGAA